MTATENRKNPGENHQAEKNIIQSNETLWELSISMLKKCLLNFVEDTQATI